MNEPILAGSLLFYVVGENDLQHGQLVSSDGLLWLLLSGFVEQATGKLIPTKLVPLSSIPTILENGNQKALNALPKELFADQIPQELVREYKVVDAQGLADMRGPGAVH